MTLRVKLVSLCTGGLLLFASVLSAQSTPEDYRVIAFKECEVVADFAMNEEQLDAYLALKEDESLMKEVEYPIKEIEGEMQEFTEQIQNLTDQAVQETESSIYIDKQLLEEQEFVVNQFNDFMAQHQHKFDQLSEMGKTIGRKAEAFEAALERSLVDVEYDNIRIDSPDQRVRHHCITSL